MFGPCVGDTVVDWSCSAMLPLPTDVPVVSHSGSSPSSPSYLIVVVCLVSSLSVLMCLIVLSAVMVVITTLSILIRNVRCIDLKKKKLRDYVVCSSRLFETRSYT
jgi:hypothetical protein